MIDTLNKFFISIGKLSPKATLSAAIACSLVVLLPVELAEQIGILKFRNEYKSEIGWTLILSSSYFITSVLWLFKKFIKDKIVSARTEKVRIQCLRELTSEEKGYLIEFVNGKNSINCELSDGIVRGLEAKGIIYMASNISKAFIGFPFNIQPWAKRYLESNKHLLDGYIQRTPLKRPTFL